MKKILSIIFGIALAATAHAQDASTPPTPPQPSRLQVFLENALQSSNLTGVVYGTYFNNNHAYGGGLLALYNVTPYVSVGLGSDYAGQWRMFSGTATARYTWQLSSKLAITSYALVAAGTSVGGAGNDNGSLATGEGGGFHFNYQLSDKWNAGLGAGYVQRQNCGDFSGGSEMVTATIGFKF